MSEAREWGSMKMTSQRGRAAGWAAIVTVLMTISSVVLVLIPASDDEGQVEPTLGVPAGEVVFLAVAVLSLFAMLYLVALGFIKLRDR